MMAGLDTAGMLVVAPDPRESDLRRAAASRMAAALPGAVIEVVDDPREYAARRFRGSGRSELTGWLLVVALAMLVAESAVAAAGARRTA
jgi:hypothetical protein